MSSPSPVPFHALILAAGQGTRMKSDLPKVLHPVLGRPMLRYPVDLVQRLGAASTVVVIGHGADRVREAFAGRAEVRFALQAEQRGTGHAVLSAREALPSGGTVLILTGDTPLLTDDTLRAFLATHAASGAAVTVLAADYPDPTGYGRILLQADGAVDRIVEHKDATEEERKVTLCNTGLYACDIGVLFALLDAVRPDNAQGEYYLTDILRLAREQGKKAAAYRAPDYRDFLGINDRLQLAEAAAILQQRILAAHMRAGVTVLDPQRTYVEADVALGRDTVLEPMTHLAGATRIGARCRIEMGVRIEDCTLADDVHVKAHSVLEQSAVGNGCSIGPLAHLRPASELADDVHVGNFVETKKTRIGRGSKANHLTYLGDAEIGEKVNVGAGTITCNYDGVHKHRTVIEDGAFIGSDTQLVAPVRVGRNAVVGAGTTVTRDVPPDALAVSRVPQKDIPDYRNRQKKS